MVKFMNGLKKIKGGIDKLRFQKWIFSNCAKKALHVIIVCLCYSCADISNLVPTNSSLPN